MRFGVKHKIVILTITVALLPVIVILILTSINKNSINITVGEEMDILASENISRVALDVYNMCAVLNTSSSTINQLGGSQNIKQRDFTTEAMQELRQAIIKTQVGKSGYVFVLSGKGRNKGEYIISSQGKRDGENIYNSKDYDGKYFIQSIIQKAVKLQNGEVAYESYPWQNQDNKKARMKVTAITYFKPWDWVIGAGTYQDDYYAAKNRVSDTLSDLRVYSVFGGFLILGFVVFVSIIISSKFIVKPISEMSHIASEIAAGKLNQHLHFTQDDEIGELGQALNNMADNLKKVFGGIKQNVQSLGDSAKGLSTVSGQMSDNSGELNERFLSVTSAAAEMSENISNVSVATEQASSGVSFISASTEEMNATVNEIAQNADNARKITANAVSVVNGTTDKVNVLQKNAEKITNVVDLINELAEQTKLLSLNATIEAARAGEAGKGFAVVASEVKALANQTNTATNEIQTSIKEINDSVVETVNDFNEIKAVIDTVSEIVSTIATSVEEQSITSKDIAQNVTQAAEGLNEISANVSQSASAANNISTDIAKVSTTSKQVDKASTTVNDSSTDLTGIAGELNVVIKQFELN